MLTDAILRLKIAFANIPMKGLFFWEGVLFLTEEDYQKIVEDNLVAAINSLVKDSRELISDYHKVLADLKTLRREIVADPSIRNEVEKIRESLIAEVADETVLDSMRAKVV